MKRMTGIVLAAIILALGWFLLSPLIIDVEVDEPLVLTTPSGALDMDAVMTMPADKRVAMRDDIMQSARQAPDTQAKDAMPDVPVALATGRFSDADAVHQGSGAATVYQLANDERLLRFEEFRVTNGPDLYVYLAKHPNPETAGDVTDAGFLSLGKLKGNIGNQNYAIPASVNLDDYGSVVIWCQLFGVLFSPASFEEVT